jgi:hypothetical protein
METKSIVLGVSIMALINGIFGVLNITQTTNGEQIVMGVIFLALYLFLSRKKKPLKTITTPEE